MATSAQSGPHLIPISEILHAYEVQLLKDPGIAGDSYRTGLIIGTNVAMRRQPDYDFLAGLLYGDRDRAADAIKSVKLLVERGHIVSTHRAVWGEKGEDARLCPHYALRLKRESLDRMQAMIDKAGSEDEQS